jgi:hypothetical protein
MVHPGLNLNLHTEQFVFYVIFLLAADQDSVLRGRGQVTKPLDEAAGVQSCARLQLPRPLTLS